MAVFNACKFPGLESLGNISAEEEIRTPTAVTPLPPQSSASTNFATSAFGMAKLMEIGGMWMGVDENLEGRAIDYTDFH